MKTRFTIALIFLQFQLLAQDFDSIKEQLEETVVMNAKLRSGVMPTVRKYGFNSSQMDSLNALISKFDSASLDLVISVIDQYGWLSKKKIGQEANHALFLAIQHAPESSIRQKYFPLLQESALNGGSSKSDMALMQDRILVENGKTQLYGSQSHAVDGIIQLYPIEDPENLNKRRRKVGLDKLKN